MRRGMHAKKLVFGRFRRVDVTEHIEQTCREKAVFYRRNSSGVFRVPLARVVSQALTVTDVGDGQCCFPLLWLSCYPVYKFARATGTQGDHSPMNTHYLASLFTPESIALYGASDRADSVGGVVFKNLITSGFKGRIYAINPKRDEVQGEKAYSSLDEIEELVDLVVVATPASVVSVSASRLPDSS